MAGLAQQQVGSTEDESDFRGLDNCWIYIKKTKKVSPLLLMLLKVTVSSRSGLPFYYYTGHCIKLKICILPFNVSSDNRLKCIYMGISCSGAVMAGIHSAL